MFVSYAQNCEDVLLWRALRHIKNGFYVDVGAQDPIIDSVTLAFYERGWRGLHVEPSRYYAEKLCIARPDELVLSVAISSYNGTTDFYEIPDTGLSTTLKKVAEKHQGKYANFVEQRLECVTLASILEALVNVDVHFLKIDVEGAELHVIRGNDWTMYRPWILLVEATEPGTQSESYSGWEMLLLEANYIFVYYDGLNRYYIAGERKELCAAFKVQPNIFDQFITYRQFIAERRAIDAERRAIDAERKVSEHEAVGAGLDPGIA